jgi:simple sugar transport system ATP-binding protein
MTANDAALSAEGIGKWFGAVAALRDVALSVRSGEVTCLLGDNGAGKSTLIHILSGVFQPDAGVVRVAGKPVEFMSPADALAQGIATTYQDLALVPILPIYRNFCLGLEPQRGRWPLRRLDKARARAEAQAQLHQLGIELKDVDRPVATLSGGQRQVLAIARAVHAGARILILDEPTAALGVTQAKTVLRYIRESAARGLGILLITHNVFHAHPIGDTFTILERGRVAGTFGRGELSQDRLSKYMAGLGESQNALSDVAGVNV